MAKATTVEMQEMIDLLESRQDLLEFTSHFFHKDFKRLSTKKIIRKCIEAHLGLEDMLTDLVDVAGFDYQPKGLVECFAVYTKWAEDWAEAQTAEAITPTEAPKPVNRPEGRGLGLGKGRVKGVNQTTTIRQAIMMLWDRSTIIENLAKVYGRNKKWAQQRMSTYERAYGPLGENDHILLNQEIEKDGATNE
jgi:hypothetical protein